MESIEEARFVFKDLIVQQHIVVVCAEPNAGKTTICNWIAGQCSELYKIRYVNLDCSGSDLKYYQQYAERNGFKFINFDVMQTSEAAFFASLDRCSDLTRTVYFIDTLKKFADMMGKASVKRFMARLRAYCTRGATFVLLAHVKKHKDADGSPVFEGVGDVKSDCDELIYLIPETKDGVKLVSTKPEKTRSKIIPITFRIEADRTVTQVDYVDLLRTHKRLIDEPVISAVKQVISSGTTIQKDIVAALQALGHSKGKSLHVLESYAAGTPQEWTRSKASNNAWVYVLP